MAEFPNFSHVGNPVDCWAIDDDRSCSRACSRCSPSRRVRRAESRTSTTPTGSGARARAGHATSPTTCGGLRRAPTSSRA
jgi:hypothetical protein